MRATKRQFRRDSDPIFDSIAIFGEWRAGERRGSDFFNDLKDGQPAAMPKERDARRHKVSRSLSLSWAETVRPPLVSVK
jgi:hypothetical protein